MDEFNIIVQLISLLAILLTVGFAYKTVKLSKKQLLISQKPEVFLLVPNFLSSSCDYKILRCRHYNDLSSLWYGWTRADNHPKPAPYLKFINGGNSTAIDIQAFFFCDLASFTKQLDSRQGHNDLFEISYKNGGNWLTFGSSEVPVSEKKISVIFNNPDRPFPIPFITAPGETEKAVMEIPHLFLNLLNLALCLEANNKDDFEFLQIEIPPIAVCFKYKNIEGRNFNNFSKITISHKLNQEFFCESTPINEHEFRSLTRMCSIHSK